jgi:single-strand DNA-binding protein
MRTTNLFIVRGYVGQDPKQVGRAAKVSVATNRRFQDDRGEWKEVTDWVTVTILNDATAKWVMANVRKGDPVYAECRVSEGSYEKDGRTIYTTDVIASLFDSLAPRVAEVGHDA